MFRKYVPCLALLSVAAALCSCYDNPDAVATKKECIPEVAKRLVACNEERTCEQGISRFAGYCYNSAEGDQLDICRGGSYFFEQAMNALEQNDPTLFGRMSDRQKEIVIATGQVYCTFNRN
jgi:hypothetical protein